MRERPIIFSGPMVRAIIDGRKTQTRRVCKQADFSSGMHPGGLWAQSVHPAAERGWIAWQGLHASQPEMAEFTKRQYREGFPCPYGDPGDRLWVRETWAPVSPDAEWRPIRECNIEYRADTGAARPGGWDADDDDPDAGRWRPSIHMPRWASRLTLEVTGVRVERVADISEEDARAEGVERPAWDNASCRVEFARLWDSINAGRGFGWKVNPWVWVVEFRRVRS